MPADDDVEPATGPPPASGADAAKEALARARAAAGASQAASRATGGPNRTGSRRPDAGRAGVYSGPGPDGRDPQQLGTSVERMLRERGWEQPTAVGGLTGRWAEIVGVDVAEHVVPETFEPAADGRGLLLVLRADSSSWAYTMRTLLPDLRRRIDAELGPGAVREITVLGPAAPSWKHGRFHIKGRGPRDTYG
ncbi:MAG: DciA family protein [Actinomycetales bacterium]|nr:DciA family protein [Actinomycetales bacterium]